MKFSLNIIDWQARAPGLSDVTEWQAWSRLQLPVDPAAPLPRLTALPMMTARRLNSGSKLAVDMIVHLQKKTGKKIKPETFKSVRTVQDVVDAVEQLLREE